MSKPPSPRADNLRRMREQRHANRFRPHVSREQFANDMADAVQRSADASERRAGRRAAKKASRDVG